MSMRTVKVGVDRECLSMEMQVEVFTQLANKDTTAAVSYAALLFIIGVRANWIQLFILAVMTQSDSQRNGQTHVEKNATEHQMSSLHHVTVTTQKQDTNKTAYDQVNNTTASPALTLDDSYKIPSPRLLQASLTSHIMSLLMLTDGLW